MTQKNRTSRHLSVIDADIGSGTGQVSARPHDSGSQANETVDGLDATTESLRHPQRTHLRGLGLAISKKRPYLTGQVLRRKSERGDRHALAQGAGESQQQGLLWCGLGTDRVSGRVDCPAGFAFSRLN